MSQVTERRADPRPVYIGTRAEAIAMLRSHRESGRLLEWEQQPCPVAGRVLVRYRLSDSPARRPRTAQRRRVHVAVWVGVAFVVLGLLGGTAWGVWVVINAIAAHAQTIGGGLVGLVLVVLLLGGGGCTVIVTHIRH